MRRHEEAVESVLFVEIKRVVFLGTPQDVALNMSAQQIDMQSATTKVQSRHRGEVSPKSTAVDSVSYCWWIQICIFSRNRCITFWCRTCWMEVVCLELRSSSFNHSIVRDQVPWDCGELVKGIPWHSGRGRPGWLYTYFPPSFTGLQCAAEKISAVGLHKILTTRKQQQTMPCDNQVALKLWVAAVRGDVATAI